VHHLRSGSLAAGGTLTAGMTRPASASLLRQATTVAGAAGDQADAIVAIAREIMEQQDVKAVILHVTIDGQKVVTEALGESMTGVPSA
jgi:hypothetical protein